jgi:hypothetical protein
MALQAMIDIECLSVTHWNPIILSIGCVIFEDGKSKGEYVDEFEVIFDAAQQKKDGRQKSKDTADWWKKQDKDVIAKQFGGTTPLKDGMEQLIAFLAQYDIEFYWGWNSPLDFIRIEDACTEMGLVFPTTTEYFKRMDLAVVGRVIGKAEGNKWLGNNLRRKHAKEIGGAHDALSDCKVQVEMYRDLMS